MTVTIDNISIQSHRRYAQDQRSLDPLLLKESKEVFSHPEITGTTRIFGSHWAALFGIDLLHPSWARFSPPPRYNRQAKRFFSYKIIPELHFPNEAFDDDDKNEKRKREQMKQYILKQDADRRDKSILIDFLETLHNLDDQLGQILAKKLQYHKG